MRTFFITLLGALLIWAVPGSASAQSTSDCVIVVYALSDPCFMQHRAARGPIPYDQPRICTVIHVEGRRKVVFVVQDSAGNVLNKDDSLHTEYKSDGETFCVGRHWWEKGLAGRVWFCIDWEPEYPSRASYKFSNQLESDGKIHHAVRNRLRYGQDAPSGHFVADLTHTSPVLAPALGPPE